MLSLHRTSWAIVEEIHRNIADGDKLKAYTKSLRYWNTQHFSNLLAFCIAGIPASLAGSQQQPWELNKIGSEPTLALSFPSSIQGGEHSVGGKWGSKNYSEFKGVWELAKNFMYVTWS